MRTPDTHDFEGFEQRLSSLMLQASDTVHVPSDVTSRSIRLARVHRRRQRVLTIVSTLVTVVVTCGAVLLPHALRNTHPGPPAHPTTGVVTNPVTAPTTGPAPTRSAAPTSPAAPTTSPSPLSGTGDLTTWVRSLPWAGALDVPTLSGTWGSLRLSRGGVGAAVPSTVTALTGWWHTPFGTVGELGMVSTDKSTSGASLVLLRNDGTLTGLYQGHLWGVAVEPGGARLAYGEADTSGGMPNLVHIVDLASGKETAQWPLNNAMSLRGWNTAGLIVEDTSGLDVITDAGRRHHTQSLAESDGGVATDSADILVRSDHDPSCSVVLDLSTATAGPDIACGGGWAPLSPDGQHFLDTRAGSGSHAKSPYLAAGDTGTGRLGKAFAPFEVDTFMNWKWLDSRTVWATFPVGRPAQTVAVRCDTVDATCRRVPVPSTRGSAPTTTATTGLPTCTRLQAFEGDSEGAAGTQYVTVVLQGTGTESCVVKGYPRLGPAGSTSSGDFLETGHSALGSTGAGGSGGSGSTGSGGALLVPANGLISFTFALTSDPSNDPAGCSRVPAAVTWQGTDQVSVLPSSLSLPVGAHCVGSLLRTSAFLAGPDGWVPPAS